MKYLSSSDFIEQILIDKTNDETMPGRATKLTFDLIEYLDYEQVCSLLLKSKLYSIFIDLEILCARNNLLAEREQLVRAMFTQAVIQNKDSIALYMSV